MATGTQVPQKESATPPEPTGWWRRFWRRYSPRGEFPISSAAAWAFHVFVLLLLAFSAKAFITRDPKPPTVDVVRVGDEANAAPGDGDGSAPGDSLEAVVQDPSMPANPAEVTPREEVQKVEDFKPVEKVTQIEEKQQQEVRDQAQQAVKAAQQAATSLQNARDQINKNLNKGGGNKGAGGGGGNAPTGRAARPARWILRFNTRSIPDYLDQLEGLGAQVAFADRGDKWRYFSHLTSSPKSELKDLSGEGRIYWIDENPQSAGGVARALGVANASSFLSFLPLALEEKLLKLELAYRNLEEHEILSTQFEVVRRGGGYDVMVTGQTPRK
ncbi:MAG: hypothetical protein HY000_00900 [Planctomycetes bacterium]|nr:hypothetical protein [Planctomycetota bacterium]